MFVVTGKPIVIQKNDLRYESVKRGRLQKTAIHKYLKSIRPQQYVNFYSKTKYTKRQKRIMFQRLGLECGTGFLTYTYFRQISKRLKTKCTDGSPHLIGTRPREPMSAVCRSWRTCTPPSSGNTGSLKKTFNSSFNSSKVYDFFSAIHIPEPK